MRPFGEGNTFTASGQLVHLQQCSNWTWSKPTITLGYSNVVSYALYRPITTISMALTPFDQEHIIKQRGEECVTPKFVKPAESAVCTKYRMLVVVETFEGYFSATASAAVCPDKHH